MIILFIIVPLSAIANAGSPAIWFSLFHLLFVNAIIGYIESKIIFRFKIDHRPFRIIIANYISMFVGYFLIAPLFLHPKYGRDILSVEPIEIFTAFFIAFIATLVIEYPLAIWSLKDKRQRKIVLKPFILANIVTNLAMASIYLLLE